jgi:Lamin Tail Domain
MNRLGMATLVKQKVVGRLINPSKPCNAGDNWTASVNLRGGTPCRENSVLMIETDIYLPDMIRAFPFSSDSIVLYFSKAMDQASATNISNYQMNFGRNVLSARLLSPFYNSIVLKISPALSVDSTYLIIANQSVEDCVGNNISTFYQTVKVALPSVCLRNEVIINEIMPNPQSGGSDFLEFYNRSNKVINLSTLNIANMDGNTVNDVEPITTNYLLFPEDYIVFTPEPTHVMDLPVSGNKYKLLKQTLPTYEDSEGTVLLFNNIGSVVDSFVYSNALHTPLLDDENAVSLERVNPSAPTNSASNWHSAAEAIGFSSPTKVNSNFMATRGTTLDSLITLSSKYVSPDGDSYQDFVLINYNVGLPGYIGKVVIYDAQGVPVRMLVRNELLQPSGFWQWDGTDNDGNKARLGIHLITAEFFDANGNVKKQIREVVVAGK